MAIKKYHRNESQDDYASKTSIKLEAHALTKWGQQLVEEKPALFSRLPLNETTLKALLDYQKMNSNLARKRHLMFIGKCLRKEDEQIIREKIENLKSEKLNPNSKVTFKDTIIPRLQKLIDEGEQCIEILLQETPQLERQKLRQLFRKYQKETGDKQNLALDKLSAYLS